MIRSLLILFLFLQTGLLGSAAEQESLFTQCSVKVADLERISSFRSQSPKSENCFFKTFHYSSNRICSDFRNFYGVDNILNYSLALGGGAILANTPMDQHFADWYQRDVRSSGTDDISKSCKIFGEWTVWVPIMAVSAISYRVIQQSDWNRLEKSSPLGEFTARTARAYLVGEPTLLFWQSMTGADRPLAGDPKGSYWRPFRNDHGVSGHAYIGAVPFITAAQMVDPPILKGVFYACSVLPAWSRVNDNSHYLSQAILGWYLAYLSCRAVSKTEGVKLPKGLTLFPVAETNGAVGFGFLYRR